MEFVRVTRPRSCLDFEPRKIDGTQPRNCDKHEKEIPEDSSYREAYDEVLVHIEQDPRYNCCTIDEDNKVKFWKARVLPVKLEKVDKSITFVCSEEMNLQ